MSVQGKNRVFYPAASRYITCYLLLIHCFAFICIIASAKGALLMLLLFCLFGSAFYYLIVQSTNLYQSSGHGVEWLHGKYWRLYSNKEKKTDVLIEGSSIVMRYFMVLHFVDVQSSMKKTVLICPDSLPYAQLKVLRRLVLVCFL